MTPSSVLPQDLQLVDSTLRNQVFSAPFSDAEWSNLAKIVYRRTYSRDKPLGGSESFQDTVYRVIRGNIGRVDPKFLQSNEAERLAYFMLNRKAMPAGRGLWYSGTASHERMGGIALNNCWFLSSDDWENLVVAFDLLLQGGGVGFSVEHRFVSKLGKIKKGVVAVHRATKDADFIVPDSREGWCELLRRVLESFFKTGKSFSYSTVCVRGSGEKIGGFGGVASGPIPLISCVDKISEILTQREGKHVRPVDAMDILCSIGECVVSGNVRRSAIIILGDAWDKEYLRAKRWDLGPIPTQRAMANLSVVCDDVDDLHPLFWKTYEHGEPFGILNRKNMQAYGRMGEKKRDTAIGTNPCGEASLESFEPCNLQDIFLPNLKDQAEFIEASRLMHRYGKRVTMEQYSNPDVDKVIKQNRRVGTGITGCLQSSLFNAGDLDAGYEAIQRENASYSKQLGINESIRTTVVKPSGTLSLMGDCSPGIHPFYSRHYIRRVRFAANDKLIPLLREAGHPVEPVQKFDGSLDHGTLVSEFFCAAPPAAACSDEGYDTWKQLAALMLAQRHWADQSVSVTVYYRKEEIPRIKEWLKENIHNLKAISFLCHNDHGFVQAPLEAISKEQFERFSEKIKPISFDAIAIGELASLECEGGICPIR